MAAVVVGNDGIFDVSFRFRPGYGRYKDCVKTICVICQISAFKTGSEKYEPVIEASVQRNLEDNPDRGVGRRKSLQKALKQAAFSRKSRTFFWNWYFKQHSDKVGIV